MKKLAILIFLAMFSAGGCAQKVQHYGYKVEQTLPHDITAYTQGLFFYKGELYESAGQYGESSIRQVDLATGKVLRRENFDSKYFLEGSCVVKDKLYILTWQERVCFVYDVNTFKQLGQFPNRREGWGLTTDGTSLIMSDGTAQIYFLDPDSFMEKRSVTVRMEGKTVPYLNELEYIDGKIWANVYTTDMILIINPEDGIVEGVVDCSSILPRNLRTTRTDVFNGIAWNPADNSIYVTGKYWPKMYKITLVKQ